MSPSNDKSVDYINIITLAIRLSDKHFQLIGSLTWIKDGTFGVGGYGASEIKNSIKLTKRLNAMSRIVSS